MKQVLTRSRGIRMPLSHRTYEAYISDLTDDLNGAEDGDLKEVIQKKITRIESLWRRLNKPTTKAATAAKNISKSLGITKPLEKTKTIRRRGKKNVN